MRLTPVIVEAVEAACDAVGGGAALARASGMNQSQISRIRRGLGQTLQDRTWESLYPHIRRYLPQDVPAPGQVVSAAGTVLELTEDEKQCLAMYRAAGAAGRVAIRKAAEAAFIEATLGGSKAG